MIKSSIFIAQIEDKQLLEKVLTSIKILKWRGKAQGKISIKFLFKKTINPNKIFLFETR